MAKQDYSNLRQKTVLDFCTNENVLRDYVPYPKEDVKGREQWAKSMKAHPECNWTSLDRYAEETSNKALQKAVEEQFAEEIRATFNE